MDLTTTSSTGRPPGIPNDWVQDPTTGVWGPPSGSAPPPPSTTSTNDAKYSSSSTPGTPSDTQPNYDASSTYNPPPATSQPAAPPPPATPPAASPSGSYQFAGFDTARLNDPGIYNTAKYAAYQVLQGLDPNDPQSIQKAYATLNAKFPGAFSLDADGNLMLNGINGEGGAGYIGSRPVGYNGTSWDTSNGMQWQWFGYNAAHPGPQGEGATPAGTAAPAIAAPSLTTSPGGAPATPTSDPFASMGGGVYVNGGWLPPDNPAAKQALADGTGKTLAELQAGQSTTTTTTTGGPPIAASTSSADQANVDAKNAAVLQLLQQASQPVDAAALQSSPEAAAYRLSAQRSAEQQQAQAAEQAAQSGQAGTGGAEGEARAIRAQAAEGTAGFIGQLAVTKTQQKIQQLQDAISTAQSQGQFDQAQALQVQLANQQAALQQQSITNQAQEAAAALALQRELGLSQQEFQQLQLSAQGQQFLQSLGFSYAQLQATADYQNSQLALQAGTGG
jgi:hypothetical protein